MKNTREETKKNPKRKKRSRRGLKVVLTVFLVFALTTGALFGFFYLFPARNVTVSGSEIYTPAQIIKASGINSKDNIFLVSKSAVEKHMRQKLPYVDSINIERKMPDGIKIKVRDAVEYAAFKISDKYFAVSERGYVLNIYDAAPDNAIEIICPEDSVFCEVGYQTVFEKESAKANCKELISLLNDSGIKINRVDVSNPVSLTVKIEGRFNVLFGTSADLDKKVAHLAKMCASIDATKSGKINLSMWTSEKTEGSFVEGEIE